MDKFMFMLPLVALMGASSIGCADEYAYNPPYVVATNTVTPTSVDPKYGCVVVSDVYGEREVCNTHYYYSDGYPIYWDASFGIWVGRGGYYRGGRWYRGYAPGYYNHYHGAYRPHGTFHGGGFHGGGGYHGGGGHR